jgi:hypothetical protein
MMYLHTAHSMVFRGWGRVAYFESTYLASLLYLNRDFRVCRNITFPSIPCKQKMHLSYNYFCYLSICFSCKNRNFWFINLQTLYLQISKSVYCLSDKFLDFNFELNNSYSPSKIIIASLHSIQFRTKYDMSLRKNVANFCVNRTGC